MSKMRVLIAFLLLWTTLVHADLTEKTLTEHIVKEFVTQSSVDWEDFQVCEIHSKNEDKRAFIASSLGERYIAKAKTVDSKEIFVRAEGASSGLHLGVVALSYPDERTAIEIYGLAESNDSKFFDNTFILTQYAVLRRNDIVVFLYSETFLDSKLKKFFESINGALANLEK